MPKYLPCHINHSTLSRASLPFGVFEERKSRRTAIRADTRAMPSDSCNSEECWYLILPSERESRGVRNDVWRRGKQIERGEKNQITSWKCSNNHWSAPATELAKNRLNWKFSWYFMMGVACNKGRRENFPSDSFVFILAVLTNPPIFLSQFQTQPEIVGVIKGDGLASHSDESVMGWERGLRVPLKVMASHLEQTDFQLCS